MDVKEWDKIAKKYFKEIGSPFQEGVKNPIYKFLDSIETKNKNVIDIGCGIGNLIPIIAERFKEVTAIDFSTKMIEVAKKNKFKNVKFKVHDMGDMKEFYDGFDVAISVNSILSASVREVDKIFSEIYKVVKEKGIFIGIFPSIDSDLYRAILTFERELEACGDEELARKRTYRIIGRDTYDFLIGMFDNEGKQKHYYGFELLYRLRKVGFKNVRIKKVLYPWKLTEDPDPKFENKPKLWDWFVSCEK